MSTHDGILFQYPPLTSLDTQNSRLGAQPVSCLSTASNISVRTTQSILVYSNMTVKLTATQVHSYFLTTEFFFIQRKIPAAHIKGHLQTPFQASTRESSMLITQD